MEHKVEKVIPETTKIVVEKVTCDLCGSEIAPKGYNIDEIIVSHVTGCSTPDGGYGDRIEYDLCGKCFDTRLVPWLKENGAEPRLSDW